MIQFQNAFNAIEFVKLCGHAKDIFNIDNIKGKAQNKVDCLVVISGANDVTCNETQAFLSSIENTLQKLKEDRKVIIVDLPKRFDLEDLVLCQCPDKGN